MDGFWSIRFSCSLYVLLHSYTPRSSVGGRRANPVKNPGNDNRTPRLNLLLPRSLSPNLLRPFHHPLQRLSRSISPQLIRRIRSNALWDFLRRIRLSLGDVWELAFECGGDTGGAERYGGGTGGDGFRCVHGIVCALFPLSSFVPIRSLIGLIERKRSVPRTKKTD